MVVHPFPSDNHFLYYEIIIYFCFPPALRLFSWLRFDKVYATGAAINNDANVPMITPSSIANVKLRIVSPPRMKIHNNTSNVLVEVIVVRANVLFSEWLNVSNKSCLG